MSFTILCNSVNGTQVGSSNNNVSYSFDFAVYSQHQGPFKLYYTFLSSGGMNLSSTDILYLQTTLPVSTNNFIALQNVNGSAKTNIIGTIQNSNSATDGYYYSDFIQKTPAILQSLPTTQPNFQISLYNAITGALDTKIGTTPYTLILYFEAIE